MFISTMDGLFEYDSVWYNEYLNWLYRILFNLIKNDGLINKMFYRDEIYYFSDVDIKFYPFVFVPPSHENHFGDLDGISTSI